MLSHIDVKSRVLMTDVCRVHKINNLFLIFMLWKPVIRSTVPCHHYIHSGGTICALEEIIVKISVRIFLSANVTKRSF